MKTDITYSQCTYQSNGNMFQAENITLKTMIWYNEKVNPLTVSVPLT